MTPEQKAFEKWAEPLGVYLEKLKSNDAYLSIQTHKLFCNWQAAISWARGRAEPVGYVAPEAIAWLNSASPMAHITTQICNSVNAEGRLGIYTFPPSLAELRRRLEAKQKELVSRLHIDPMEQGQVLAIGWVKGILDELEGKR